MVRRVIASAGWYLAGLGIAGIRWARKITKSNKRLYKLVYSLRNSKEFSDLYEHEKMLADPVRVSSYARGIRRNIKEGDVVLDLGTGNGILSLLAARQGAKVYAIDHSDFIGHAEENARRNQVKGITFIRANSKSLQLPEKIDVLLHEQIGDNLFNENMIENLLDLKQRLLKPEGRILPGRFHLFLEPVSLKLEYRVPFMEEIRVEGFDFRYLAQAGRAFRSADYGRRRVERDGIDFFLCEPEPILTVDLNQGTEAPSGLLDLKASRRVLRPGQMDGIYQYFEIVFDEETRFDTSPFSRRTHWTNRVFRTPQRRFAAGDQINYSLGIGDLAMSDSWSLTLSEPVPAAASPIAAAPVTEPA